MHVRRVEEVSKQDEITGVQSQRQHDIRGRCRTRLSLLFVTNGSDIDNAAGDHLSELKEGDRLLHRSRYANASCSQSEVPVHDRMDTKVHRHEPSASGRKHRVTEDVNQRRSMDASATACRPLPVETVDEHGCMVIPMEEDERLPSENDK